MQKYELRAVPATGLKKNRFGHGCFWLPLLLRPF